MIHDVEYDAGDGAPLIGVSFCPHCGDDSVPAMNTHLTDQGEWTCKTVCKDHNRCSDLRCGCPCHQESEVGR